MKLKTGLQGIIVAFGVSHAAFADTNIALGSTARVTNLFSYPNCGNDCPTPAPTLEDTVTHYLLQNVARDGYPQAQISVSTSNDQVTAQLSNVPDAYAAQFSQALTSFLAAGDTALTGVDGIRQANLWKSDWTFLLPLGLSMVKHPTVELLHFPPESVLQKQDYLNNPTTNRWADLLKDNQVAAGDTDAYQTIVDIAPIAAPSNAGSEFTGIYSYFTPYIQQLLSNWTANDTTTSRPMVAFGAPARNWLIQQYNLTSLDVLQLADIQVNANQPKVAVLGSNHPSYIWYAADPSNYGGDMNKANAAGLTVMMQDLTAACWQANMGSNPSNNAQTTLTSCQTNWMQTNALQSCELFFESIRNYTSDQALVACTPLMPGPVIPATQLVKEPS